MIVPYSRGLMLAVGGVVLFGLYATVKGHPAFIFVVIVAMTVGTLSAAQETRRRFKAQSKPLCCPVCQIPLLRSPVLMVGLCPRCNVSYTVEKK